MAAVPAVVNPVLMNERRPTALGASLDIFFIDMLLVRFGRARQIGKSG
jgi:hypothetical protein